MKVILTGDFSFAFKDIYGFLDGKLNVQVSPFDAGSLGMISRVVNPSLFVICITEVEPDTSRIFDFISEKYPGVHKLVIVSKENYPFISDKCLSERVHVLLRPITNIQLLDTFRNIISVIEPDDTQDNDRQQEELLPKFNIMVVDDSGMMLRNIKSMLSDNYNLQLAKSGEQAIKMIDMKRPDLVLLDYNMQGMNGVETFERIRGLEGEPIPVIFLTGVSDREKIMSAITKNPAGYILKPPAKEQLIKAIEKALNKSEDDAGSDDLI